MARLLLRDLVPGAHYQVQLRAVEGDSFSDWSRLFDLQVTADVVAPDVPQWAVLDPWVSVGETFVANWDAVDNNLDKNKDLAFYEIEFGDGITTRTVSTINTTYTLTFEQNGIYFGSPKPTVTARIRAVDAIGNVSAWNDLKSATNPAPTAPATITAEAVSDGIGLKWDASPDSDVIGYYVHVGTTAAFVPAVSNRIFNGKALSFNYPTTSYGVDHWFKVYAVDVFGQQSITPTATTAAVRPSSPFVLDTTAPATPTGLTANITNNANGIGARVTVAWTMTNPPSDLAGFYVRAQRAGDSTWTTIGTFQKDDRAAIIELQSAYTNYTFQIKAFDWQNNESAWSTGVLATSPSNTAPGQVTGLASVAGRDSIRYTWTPSTAADLKEYEVTFSTSSTFASNNITFKTGTAAVLDVGGLTPATTYYARVRAIDSGGLTGTFSATDTKATLAQLTPGDIGAPTTGQFNTAVKTYSVEYSVNSSETVAPTTGWSTATPTRTPGTFIWTRTVVTYQDDTSSTTNPALLTGNAGEPGVEGPQGDPGAPGDPGATGVGVSSITPYFRTVTTGSAAPAAPTTNPPAAPWTSTEPNYAANTELYRTDRVVYTDTTFAYTPVTKVAAYTAATTAITAANGKNKIIFSTGDATGTAYTAGDTWYKRDGNGIIIATWEFTTSWQPRTFGDATLASLNVGKLVSGDLDAITVNVAASGVIKSTNYAAGSAGWKLDASGLEINNGAVKASALRAGVLGSDTGIIQIAAGASIVMNGGYIKSNTNTGTTLATAETSGAGFFLNVDGLFIGGDSRIRANALISDTLTSTVITLGTGGRIVGGGGWELNSGGLSIPNGGIAAAKLMIQEGSNAAPADIADFEYPASYYTTNGFNGRLTRGLSGTGSAGNFAIVTTQSKYNSQSLQTNWTVVGTGATYMDMYLSASNTTYNVPVDPSTPYIVSAYFKPQPGTGNKNVQWIKNDNGTGVAATFGSQVAIVDNDTWQRHSAVFTTHAAATAACFRYRQYHSGTLYMDGFQVERQLTNLTTPSPWSPPGVTLVDGNLIRTGIIRSTEPAYDADGVAIPNMSAWQIDLEGDAILGNAWVRGNLTVGDDADDYLSVVQSSNYVTGLAGWQLRSDGTGSLLGLDAESIRGESVVTNSLSVNRLSGGGLSDEITLEAGSSLIARGLMGEKVSLGDYGFIVNGPQENTVTNKSASGTTATLITAVAHNLSVGSRLVVRVGDPVFDGLFAVASVPNSTTFTYTKGNATSVASTAVANGSIQAANPALPDGPVYISFPTDGTEPNIISGELTSSLITVTEGMSIRKTSNVEQGARLIINSVIEAPKAAPTVSQSYSDLQLKSIYSTGSIVGVTRGHNGNYFVLSGTTTNYRVSEHSVTGALVANRVSVGPPGIGRWAMIDPAGLVYTPSFGGRYYLHQIWYQIEVVVVYDTSWNEIGSFTLGETTSSSGVVFPKGKIGWDHTNNRLMIGWRNASGSSSVFVRYFNMNATTGVPTSAVAGDITVAYNSSGALGFVARGSFDYGADVIVIKDKTFTDTTTPGMQYCVATTAGAVDGNRNWPVATNSSIGGAFWDAASSKFMDVNTSGIKRTYEGGDSYWSSTIMTDSRWIRYAWYRASSDLESSLSPAYHAVISKRARLGATIAPVPYSPSNASTPDKARLYVLDNVTDTFPTVTNYRLRVTVNHTSQYADINPYDMGSVGTAQPTVNDFASLSGDPGQIVSSTGLSFWKGDDTAQFYQLTVTSNTDADETSGNRPPLRVGNPVGSHLRIDGNEIISMDTTSTIGALYLNKGGMTIAGQGATGTFRIGTLGSDFKAVISGGGNVTLNTSGVGTITHSLGNSSYHVFVQSRGNANFRFITVSTKNDNNFTIRVENENGVAVATSVDVDWILFAK